MHFLVLKRIERFSLFFLISMIGLSTLVSCQTQPRLSDMQKRQMTTRVIRGGSYRNVYKSTLMILQDDGYIIRNSDYEIGLITASLTYSSGPAFYSWYYGYHTYYANTQFDVTVNIEELVKDEVEVRLTIQEQFLNNFGGVISASPIFHDEPYIQFFNKLQTEVLRRTAMKKGREE